jgi:hypothetical protein
MSIKALENLVKTGQLKNEPPNAAEIQRLLAQAKNRVKDASLKGQSEEGRFIAAYDAAHSAALAAMRWHGYRSDKRFVVFQALEHTLGWSASHWRVFDLAHKKRNLSLYEGFLEFSEADMAALVKATARLLEDAEKLVREG